MQVIEGQCDIMIRRRFIMLEYELGSNISKAYEREVRLLSHDNQYFLMAIGIRNTAVKAIPDLECRSLM